MGDLFDLKNFFVLGNYQTAINEAQSLTDLNPSQQTERDVYMYRSYVAQGKYQLVLSEIRDQSASPLGAVRLLASYLHSSSTGRTDAREAVVGTLRQWMADGQAGSNHTVQVVAGTIYYLDGNLEEAMRCVYQAPSLEGQALLVQIYLAIDRPELADKELRSMLQKDEDASIVQLATAWLYTVQGGERVNEAASIYTELIEKYGATALLLNGLASTALLQGRFSDAEKFAAQALEKNSTDPDALVNLVASQQLQSKSELLNRNLVQLQSIAPNHAWVRSLRQVEDSFSELAAGFR